MRSTFSGTMGLGKANILVFGAAVMAALLVGLLAAKPAHTATFTVTNTADNGAGSLRQAITDANATTDADTIKFNIPGTATGCNATSGVCTISPSSVLPEIINPVVIDGYSQPGARANTLAVGNNAVLKIELSGAAAGNGLKIGADNSTVQGLIISNWENGIFLDVDATRNTVRGNFIGTDTPGPQTSNNIGAVALGDANTIGGTTAAARNIFSDNGFGVQIGSANGGNKVQGNYIGTNAAGDTALGNNIGVVIDGSPKNIIGGATGTARNVISGNSTFGIRIGFTGATLNEVQGNYIGISAAGDTTLANSGDGVSIQSDADANTIGGTTAAARNIISGNSGDGVEVFFTVSDPNGGATGNRILSNSIYDNSELGIDLVHENNLTEEVTPNDTLPPPDSDTGPNNLQNFPELTSAKTTKRVTTIKGTLNSSANTTFTLQFFGSPTADDSGFGEGQKFRFQRSVTTDESGNATFSFKTRKKIPKGQVVSATATNQSTGDTSEFSAAILAS